jgi:hypothetical protein
LQMKALVFITTLFFGWNWASTGYFGIRSWAPRPLLSFFSVHPNNVCLSFSGWEVDGRR